MTDAINHPHHYTNHPSGIECIRITEHMNFCLGNATKYIWRSGLKGEREDAIADLKKARWYLDREIERLGGPRKNTLFEDAVVLTKRHAESIQTPKKINEYELLYRYFSARDALFDHFDYADGGEEIVDARDKVWSLTGIGKITFAHRPTGRPDEQWTETCEGNRSGEDLSMIPIRSYGRVSLHIVDNAHEVRFHDEEDL